MSIKTLSISLYNRPQYTDIMLTHLNRCYDIENYHILICCEPGNLEVIKLAKNFRTNQTSLVINKKRLGCNSNVYQCLKIGFGVNDYHIHIEDDTIPGKDYLLYCEWARHQYKDNKKIYSVSGYSKIISDEYARVNQRNWFTPWGWSTWIDRWKEIELGFLEQLGKITPISWDCATHRILDNRFEIFPVVSRIQNIGAENGTFVPSADWHRENQYNEYWIETDKKYQKEFYQVYE